MSACLVHGHYNVIKSLVPDYMVALLPTIQQRHNGSVTLINEKANYIKVSLGAAATSM